MASKHFMYLTLAVRSSCDPPRCPILQATALRLSPVSFPRVTQRMGWKLQNWDVTLFPHFLVGPPLCASHVNCSQAQGHAAQRCKVPLLLWRQYSPHLHRDTCCCSPQLCLAASLHPEPLTSWVPLPSQAATAAVKPRGLPFDVSAGVLHNCRS